LEIKPAYLDGIGQNSQWSLTINGKQAGETPFSGSVPLCASPPGWHLPSNADWNVLMKFVNPNCSGNCDCAGAGKSLKAKSGWNSNGNGTDNYGFSALPGGRGGSGGSFNYVGNYGSWWK